MEDDHFEDFTTASEWESFTAKLEQLLSECMAKPVDEDVNVTNGWVVIHEKLTFADFPFKFSYYRSNSAVSSEAVPPTQELTHGNKKIGEEEPQLPGYLSSLSRHDSEFPPKYAPHIVSEYFSVLEFAVLSSAGIEAVSQESRLKVLLSSACIAINNTSCNFPVFVQFHHWSQNYFCGIAESCGLRTSFQMVMLQPPNPALPTHLSGLLDILKSKIGSNLPCPIGISTHFFYKINSWPPEINFDSYPPELFEILRHADTKLSDNSGKVDADSDKTTSWSQFCAHTHILPFGSLDDPFCSMDLVAGWPNLAEDVVVDSSSYSDLEPENAQEWYFSIKSDANAEFRLFELVDGIWKLKNDRRTAEQVLGKPIDPQNDSQNFSSALEKITKNQVSLRVAGINQVIGSANRRRRAYYNTDPNAYEDLAPLNKEHMDLVMEFLFPDAKRDLQYPYPRTSFQDTHKFRKEYVNSIIESLGGVKSAPVGSLVWRISLIMAYLLAYGEQGSPSAVCHVWAELILELRYRVDNCKPICGLESGSPNIGSCLLNQKLQMLNCCITKKMTREMKQNEQEKCPEDALESDADSDDEFFDCEDNVNTVEGKEVIKINKPSGRMRKNGKLRLIKTGEPMYIPETQDPAPLTEDVLEEQSKAMIELGDDAQGSELRAKMMSASLLSDMESFKAANPGADLSDFVKWYSPRDWIETTGTTDSFGNPIGELSPRMKVPGNLWLEVWSTANQIPARRQKRLFDDTKEAEKVLHWLSTRTLMDISQLLFPCLVHAATIKIMDEIDNLAVNLNYEVPQGFAQNVVQLSRCFRYATQLDLTADEMSTNRRLVMKNFQQCEKEITQIRSFQLKFPNENINDILCQSNTRNFCGNNNSELFPNFIKVPNGKRSELGTRIFDFFVTFCEKNEGSIDEPELNRKVSNFDKPYKKAFVLKYIPPPGRIYDPNGIMTLPQRMSCLLKSDTFVLAGTFSNKTQIL